MGNEGDKLNKVKVAVIGVGNFGQHHLRIYSELPQAELVGFFEVDPQRSEMVSQKFKVPAYSDYRELFDKVDAVSIAVPTSLHFPIAMDFLTNKINVLVEKPITVGVKEAQNLVDTAREKNLILQVGHLERFNPAVRKLKSLLKTPPSYIEAHRLSFPLKRNMDVGVVWDLMIHDIDILIDLLKSEITEIKSLGFSVYTEKEDVALVELKAQNGCLASLMTSRSSGLRARNLLVMADDSIYQLDLINQTLSVRKLSGELTMEEIPVKKEEPLKLELSNFIECVATQKEPMVSGEDGKKALELAIKIVENMKILPGKNNTNFNKQEGI